ncbi:hypothetical protein B0H63DRAFT_443624 [Podospora didyma]|uniref:Uncharacterized protein n=1 Tax=Podospora didyma TaxID=330526 RepID=A0AAE0P4W9_9PEZI|nr:hypothetical protein B0H63DRAFT_443624 [Podospora didyma]
MAATLYYSNQNGAPYSLLWRTCFDFIIFIAPWALAHVLLFVFQCWPIQRGLKPSIEGTYLPIKDLFYWRQMHGRRLQPGGCQDGIEWKAQPLPDATKEDPRSVRGVLSIVSHMLNVTLSRLKLRATVEGERRSEKVGKNEKTGLSPKLLPLSRPRREIKAPNSIRVSRENGSRDICTSSHILPAAQVL